MRKQETRPVVIPLGEPVLRIAAALVLVAGVVSILTWLGWMPG